MEMEKVTAGVMEIAVLVETVWIEEIMVGLALNVKNGIVIIVNINLNV
jgi:hypothetical protein